MIKRILILVVCSFVSASAFAGGQKKVDAYSDSSSRYMDAEVKAVKGSIKDRNNAQQEFSRLQIASQQARVAVGEQAAAVEALAAKQRSYQKTRDELAATQGRLENTDPQDTAALKDLQALVKAQEEKVPDLADQVGDAQREAGKREGALSAASAAAETAKAEFEAKNGKLTADMQAVLNANSGNPTNEQIAAALGAQVRSSTAERAADELFADLDKTHYDAQLLLTNFDVLKADLKGDEIRLKALKDKFGTRLDNTLLGDYVNKKIQAATSCAAINKCNGSALGETKATSGASDSKVDVQIVNPPTSGQGDSNANGGN